MFEREADYYSHPPQYRPSVHPLALPPNTATSFTFPPNTTAHFQVPNTVFLGYIILYITVFDSFHRRFPNTAAFSPVPRSAVLGWTTVILDKGQSLTTRVFFNHSCELNYQFTEWKGIAQA